MAGGGSDDDNPVPLNVTPLIDIIFCLIIFFMCSFHFKSIEGRLDAWMPKDRGVHPSDAPQAILDEIRIILTNERGGPVRRLFGAREVASDDELAGLITAQQADFRTVRHAEVPVTIDAKRGVPWEAVVHVLDLCRARHIDKVMFASPLPLDAP